MHTDIRWMSCGKYLERFVALRIEIPVFSDCFRPLCAYERARRIAKMLPNARSFLPSREKKLKSLQEHFKIRFQDFHVMQPRTRTDLVADPLTVAVSEQP